MSRAVTAASNVRRRRARMLRWRTLVEPVAVDEQLHLRDRVRGHGEGQRQVDLVVEGVDPQAHLAGRRGAVVAAVAVGTDGQRVVLHHQQAVVAAGPACPPRS